MLKRGMILKNEHGPLLRPGDVLIWVDPSRVITIDAVLSVAVVDAPGDLSGCVPAITTGNTLRDFSDSGELMRFTWRLQLASNRDTILHSRNSGKLVSIFGKLFLLDLDSMRTRLLHA